MNRNWLEDMPFLEPWVKLWYLNNSAVYLRSYLSKRKRSGLIPETEKEIKTLMACFLLDKAVYELGYELNNRP